MSESILRRPAPAADFRLSYGPEASQFGDLRVPDGSGPHSCIVVIHGGFWRDRYDLEHIGHLCHALTLSGFATWNIEYRRLGEPGGGWPGTFDDVVQAAHHLFALAPDHHINPAQVSVLGHSAGGHLALWLAGLLSVSATSALHCAPLAFRAAISLAGVLDLRQAWALGLSDGAAERLLDGVPHDRPERYAAASPRELLPLGVSQLLVHGIDDDTVPMSMSETYHAAAIARGDRATLLRLPNIGHFDLIDPSSTAWSTVFQALSSLVRK